MGLDISFHPIDCELIRERLLPFIMGEGSIDDVIDRAVRVSRVRLIAKAWGLGLVELAMEQRGVGFESPPPDAPLIPSAFAEDLHVWGRPFLITASDTGSVLASYDSYLAADPQDTNDLACAMIDSLAPSLSEFIVRQEGATQDAQRLSWEVSWRMKLFRDAFSAHQQGTSVALTNDMNVNPADLFSAEFAASMISFASCMLPGWLAQGYTWPTYLLPNAGVGIPDVFERAEHLFEPLLDEFPSIALSMGETLGDGQKIGGYVRPQNVQIFLDHLRKHRNTVLDWAHTDDWGTECGHDYDKLVEAVTYAAANDFGFLEVSGLYSPAFGLYN